MFVFPIKKAFALPDYTITNDIINVTMGAGQTYSSKISIADKSSTESMDLQVATAGLGQGTDGATIALTAAQDTSPYSAITFCSIDKTSLHIEPGATGDVTATVTVPAGKRAGEYYAAIYFYTQSSSQDKVGFNLAIIVPVIVTIPNFTKNVATQITGPSVPATTSSQTIVVTTMLQNSGNCRISSAADTVTLYNASNTQLAQSVIQLSAPSILPTFSRQFVANFAAQPAGSYTVKSQIRLGDGTLLTEHSATFTIQASNGTGAAPTISSFTPASGAAGTQVTITGTGFTGATGVGFGGIAASYNINSDAQITATVSNGATGAVTVTGPGGTATSSGTFTYLATPVITSFSPSSGRSNTTVIISGRNFTGATAVQFGGTAASSFTVNSATQITAVTGSGSTGAITVITPNGTATSAGAFTFSSAAPLISSAAPLSGGTGTTVYIYGFNLSGATGVSFGGTPAQSFLANSDTQIAAVVGNGSTGKITVTTPSGTAISTFNFIFTPSTTTPTTTTTSTSTSTTSVTTSPSKTTATTSVTKEASNYLLSGMDPASLTVYQFTNQPTRYINAVDKADTEVDIIGSCSSGTIIIGKYINEPSVRSGFSTGIIKGGTGRPAIKYADVRVEGCASGTARITIHYTSQEVSGFDKNKLFLAYYFNNKWHDLDNLDNQTDGNAVSGDVPVSRLNGTVIALGGDMLQDSGSLSLGSMGTTSSVSAPAQGISWSLVAFIIGPIVLCGVIIVALIERRRKFQANQNQSGNSD